MPGLARFPRQTAADVAKVLGIGLVLALLTYREIVLIPGPGLDNSWLAGLSVAAHSSLNWGPDIDFTYGPLGFLAAPKMYYDDTAILSVVWVEFAQALALGTVYVLARRGLGVVATVALLVLAGSSLRAPEIVFAAAVSIALVQRTARHPQTRPLLAALAVYAAVNVLVKLSTGASVGAVALVAALTGPGTRRERRDDVLLLAGVFLLAALAAWGATGQRLDAIPIYVRSSLEIVSGYNASMQTDDPRVVFDYTLALIVFVGGLVAIRMASETLPARAARGAALVWLVACFLQFKAGFVRHDPGHALLLFSAAPLIVMVVVTRLRSRGAALALVLAPLAAMVSVGSLRVDQMWSPVQGVREAFTQAGDLADNAYRGRQRDIGRRFIMQTDQLPPPVFDDLEGRSTYVHPAETAVVWAYGLKWRPVPTFQSYVAYTDRLDRDNAKRLADPEKGPERVLLHQEGSIDGRFLGFDEPQLTLTMLCRFDVSVAEAAWASLARTPDRCGAPRKLKTVKAHWGTRVPVPVPPRGMAIVADLDGIAVGGTESLRSFLYKAHVRTIVLGDQPHRLVPGSGDGPLLLRAADGLDLPAPFSQIPQTDAITLHKASTSDGTGDLRITFSAVPFRRR